MARPVFVPPARRDNAPMSPTSIQLTVNGEPRVLPAPLDIPALLAAEGLGERRVAVEVNGEIVPRSRHAGFALADGDRVEIVHALGGG
jgi:sulfur carrier protein